MMTEGDPASKCVSQISNILQTEDIVQHNMHPAVLKFQD